MNTRNADAAKDAAEGRPTVATEKTEPTKAEQEARVAELQAVLDANVTPYREYEKAHRDMRSGKITPEAAAEIKSRTQEAHAAYWTAYEQQRKVRNALGLVKARVKGSGTTSPTGTTSNAKTAGSKAKAAGSSKKAGTSASKKAGTSGSKRKGSSAKKAASAPGPTPAA